MDREGDVDAPALRAALIDLSRTLDSLRERLEPRERPRNHQGLVPPDRGAPADPDARALGIVQGLLSSPSAGLQPDEIFARAMERASRQIAAERAMLFLVEAGESRLVARAARGFRKEDLGSISVQPGEGIVGRAFGERRLIVYAGVGDGEVPDAFVERMRVGEAIAVPVQSGDDVAGVLFVGRHRPGSPFSAGDALLLLAIAARVGNGLVRQSQLDRRARWTECLADLRIFVDRLSFPRPLNDVLAEACEIGCRLAKVRAAAVAVEARTDELTILAAQGLPPVASGRGTVSARAGLTAELYAGNAFVACRDVRSRPIPERSFLADGGFRGCLLVPLRPKAGAPGVLYLADTAAREFSEEEIEAARTLAALVASALDRSRSVPEGREAPAGDVSIHERAAQMEKARALSEMAGGLARELTNVFAVILGKSRLVLGRIHDEPLREGLTLLEEAAWRGADVVHRLGALVAPVADEASGSVDMVALVRDVVAEARSRWKGDVEGGGAGIDVAADVQAGPPVRGSEAVLRDVLMNLVQNAVDAMPAGGRLTLSTRPVDGGMEVVVEDTGEGIAEDARERLFDPFFTTRSPKHLGLGLNVAEGVILRYGGRIEVSAPRHPRNGTRVTVWLPEDKSPGRPHATRADIAREPAKERSDPAISADLGTKTEPSAIKPSGRAPRPDTEMRGEANEGTALSVTPSARRAISILLLEDEESVRSMIVEALTQAGHEVDAVPDALSGLAKLESGSFDVVLTDLALPQQSGLAVARSVKRLHPQTPVILITGWGHLLDPERLREHGVDLMLVKPFRSDRAVSLVSQALALRAAPR